MYKQHLVTFLLPAGSEEQAEYVLYTTTIWRLELKAIFVDDNEVLQAVYSRKQ